MSAKHPHLSFILWFLLVGGTLCAQSAPSPAPPRALASLPLGFMENKGQSHPLVRYEARGLSGSVALLPSGPVLSLAPTAAAPGLRAPRQASPLPDFRVAVRFVNARPSPGLSPVDRLPGTVNFFSGSDKKKWLTGLATYRKVIYDDLYDGIDLDYTGRDGRLKGTFLVGTGADPRGIRWRYDGVRSVALDKKTGDLVLDLGDSRYGVGGRLRELAPVAWQQIDGKRFDVDVKFRLHENGEVSFLLGTYDPHHDLVIDPTMIFATHFGGNGTDHCISTKMDKHGRIYMAGRTHSNPAINAGQGWPVTPQAFDPTYNGEVADAFVMMLSEDGQTLIFSSYLGGGDPTNFSIFGGADWGLDLDVDQFGNVYVVGFTESSNFPITADAIQPQRNGVAMDAFITIVTPHGDGILYSSYIGGTSLDFATAVEVDSDGYVWVGGYTYSSDFPTLSKSYQALFGGVEDMFLVKFRPGQSLYTYATYLGWGGVEECFDIELGPEGSGLVYVGGFSDSTVDFSTFPNLVDIISPQPTNAGFSDALLAILRPRNQGPADLVYATFWGGSGPDNLMGMDVSDTGDAFITGLSGSMDFPLDLSSFTINGGGDMYAARITPNGLGLTDIRFSTVIGGTAYDVGYDIRFYNNQVYVTGIITGIFGADGFLTILGDFGALISTTAIGGPFFEEGLTLDVNETGIVIAGYGQCQNTEINFQNCMSGFPYLNAYQPFFAGGSGDGWIAKWAH
ncbi:MAG TPA: hypothetical protein ENK43_11535 [Planctomycetes bacterium]|nr:hypothetical protein [Planctomycetota bacterium]